jgi:hypothetical protein
MIRKTRVSLAWLAAGLVVVASSAFAQPKPDSLALLKTQADSISAVVGRALLNRDSVLLASALSDTVGVVLPGNKATNGRETISKYFPLFFGTVGGSALQTTRTIIEKVPGYDHLARQGGEYTLTRTDAAGKEEKRRGKYVVYWNYTDTTWIVERLFVSKK